MKHVFVINSHTTYLTAMGTIDYLKLEVSSIIILLVRNYKNTYMRKDYRILDASDLSYKSEKAFASRNLRRKDKVEMIKIIDSSLFSFNIIDVGAPLSIAEPFGWSSSIS